MRICSGAGCLAKVPNHTRFCDACANECTHSTDDIRQHTVSDRDRYRGLYGSVRWTKLARIILRRDPLCKRCGKALSEIADHVIPAGIAIAQTRASGRWPYDAFAGFYLKSNLQGQCRSCHAIKTDEDKAHRGAWPDVIESYDAYVRAK